MNKSEQNISVAKIHRQFCVLKSSCHTTGNSIAIDSCLVVKAVLS